MTKEDLRPLYSELQGYLSQAPHSDKPYEGISSEAMWLQYNKTVDLISRTSGEDFSRFSITEVESSSGGGKFIRLALYRQKLNGLIGAMYGKYFADEPAPFSSTPSMIVSQNQQQTQTFYIQMLLDIQSKIDEKLPGFKEGSKEKSFLQKFKNTLSSISNVSQLISQLTKIAKDCGLGVDDISRLFS